MTQRNFLQLKLKKLKLKKFEHLYRIYKNSTEFIDIEASSACHAIEESNIEHPLKVIFLGYTDIDKVLSQDDVEITEDATIDETIPNELPINNLEKIEDKINSSNLESIDAKTSNENTSITNSEIINPQT